MNNRKNWLVLTSVIFLFVLLMPSNTAHGIFLCPAELDDSDIVEDLKDRYHMMVIDFEDEILRIMGESVTDATKMSVAKFIVEEKKEDLENIGLAAKCLIIARVDPNLVKNFNPVITSILKEHFDMVQLVAPNYTTYVLANNSSKTICNDQLVAIVKEEYQSKIDSIESDLQILLNNDMRSHDDNFDIKEPDVKANLFDKIFSDHARKVELIKDLQYLKECDIDPKTMIKISNDVKELFNHDFELSESYLIFSFDEMPAKKQSQLGITNDEIKCAAGKVLIIKSSDNSPACTSFRTAEVLEKRGWGNIISDTIR